MRAYEDLTDPTDELDIAAAVPARINCAFMVYYHDEPRFVLTRSFGTKPVGMAGSEDAGPADRTVEQAATTNGMVAAYRLAGVI